MNYNIQKLQETNVQLLEQLRHYTYDVIGCCQQVHKEMGPFLNEYMYQDALNILLHEKDIPCQKEYIFSVLFHGQTIQHKHRVDFFIKDNIFVECKAVENLCSDHRQQLWNYMRLTKVPLGILYNFAPVQDQCERYYYDANHETISMF